MSDPQTTAALVDAAWQVLDEMGTQTASCCLLAKAKLRVAVEPFLTDDTPMDWPLAEAKAIIKDCEDA
jgi:hypothetical protein